MSNVTWATDMDILAEEVFQMYELYEPEYIAKAFWWGFQSQKLKDQCALGIEPCEFKRFDYPCDHGTR